MGVTVYYAESSLLIEGDLRDEVSLSHSRLRDGFPLAFSDGTLLHVTLDDNYVTRFEVQPGVGAAEPEHTAAEDRPEGERDSDLVTLDGQIVWAVTGVGQPLRDQQRDAARAYAVLDHVDADERRLRQGDWLTAAALLADPPPCGTAACFAGWTCLLAGDEPVFRDGRLIGSEVTTPQGERVHVRRRATQLLGLSPASRHSSAVADRLFDANNTREDLGRLVERHFGPRPAPAATDTANPEG